MDLTGARLLVVGASSGIGRAVGLAALDRGAHVAFAARRLDRLESIVDESPHGDRAHAIELDVRDEPQTRAQIDKAAVALGGLDAVVYTAGIASITPVADIDAKTWHELLETNLVGAAVTASAALEHLRERHGVIFLCSSTAAERQRWGLNAYGVTKAAVNRLADALHSEHPDVRVVKATVGSTLGTEFGDDFDGEVLNDAMTRWVAAAEHDATYMSLQSLSEVIVGVIGMLFAHPDVDIRAITIQPPGGALTMEPSSDMLDRFFGSMKTRRE
jgi:NADP-dependent 3-hydroxy acid dehydrogenase YdfG